MNDKIDKRKKYIQLQDITADELRGAVNKCRSYKELRQTLGISPWAKTNVIKARLSEEGISDSHFGRTALW